jgi:hypothetical protein
MSCFLPSRILPDGGRNRIQLAAGEYDDAVAWMVGDEATGCG